MPTQLLSDPELAAVEAAIRAELLYGGSKKDVAERVRRRYPTCGVSGGIVELVQGGLTLREAIRRSALMPRIPTSWPIDPSAYFVPFERRLDGAWIDFGTSFWRVLADYSPVSAGPSAALRSIRYDDPYLSSPLTIRLAWAIQNAAPGYAAMTACSIRTARLRRSNRGPPTAFHHHFSDDRIRTNLLRALFNAVDVRDRPGETDLERPLVVEYVNGTSFVVALGHTISRMETCGHVAFQAAGPPSDLAAQILACDARLRTKPDAGPSWCIVVAPAPVAYLQ